MICFQGALLYLLYLGNGSRYLDPRSWVGKPRSKAWLEAKQAATWVIKQFGNYDQKMRTDNPSASASQSTINLRSSGYGSWHQFKNPPKCKKLTLSHPPRPIMFSAKELSFLFSNRIVILLADKHCQVPGRFMKWCVRFRYHAGHAPQEARNSLSRAQILSTS